MGFRSLLITSKSKLSYKNNYLLVKTDEDLKSVHLSEIVTIVIDSTMVTMSSYLLMELSKNKINIILCDERHNPYGEFLSYYSCYNTSKKISFQIKWNDLLKQKVWQEIVKIKIYNQKQILKKNGFETSKLLENYCSEVEIDDVTNREGHAAKIYFNSLFGNEFSRSQDNSINAALNYGYSIILSFINREIVCNGYLTQMGIKHKNEFNEFNLGCDLMEIFRPVVDEFVYDNISLEFDIEVKKSLIDLLNQKYKYQNKTYILSDIMKIYVKSIFNSLEQDNINLLEGFYLYEEPYYENDCII